MGGKICANMKFTSASTLLQETYDTNHKKLFEKKKKKKALPFLISILAITKSLCKGIFSSQ